MWLLQTLPPYSSLLTTQFSDHDKKHGELVPGQLPLPECQEDKAVVSGLQQEMNSSCFNSALPQWLENGPVPHSHHTRPAMVMSHQNYGEEGPATSPSTLNSSIYSKWCWTKARKIGASPKKQVLCGVPVMQWLIPTKSSPRKINR